jgi:hypothetical protein
MLKQRRDEVSRTVTTALVDVESNLDKALLSHARLQIAVIEGRRSANLPLDAGQAGLDKMSEAVGHLVAARKAIHEAHYAFRQTRTDLRMPTTSYGDFGDTPDGGMVPAEHVGLALVHAAA